MNRAQRILTHGWIGNRALTVLTRGYFPVVFAIGKVCAAITLSIPGATMTLSLPGAAMAMSLPGADMDLTIPGVDMSMAIPSANIEFTDCN